MNANKAHDTGDVNSASVLEVRLAQAEWAARSITDRLKVVRRARGLIAERARELAAAAAGEGKGAASEALISQVLPLADACLFLERKGERILAPRRLGAAGRPLWLFGVESEIWREPFGIVLIIAPANYPLFLPAVQIVQALVAGDAVLLKPGAGGTRAASSLQRILIDSGLDPRLLLILGESEESAREALALPIDKVFFTGSSAVGTKVMQAVANRAIPSVVELSGCDAVYIREDADLTMCVEGIRFGLRWNGGATCIGPRRIYIARRIAERFEAQLCDALAGEGYEAPASVAQAIGPALQDAVERGGTVLVGGLDARGAMQLPCVIGSAGREMEIMRTAHFAPVLGIMAVDSDEEALARAGECPYALGANIFSTDLVRARELAARVTAGVVLINDMIVPTADPRIPFCGRKRSGYGATRGEEGLLEMTVPKVVQIRTGRQRPHFKPTRQGDSELFHAWIQAAHASHWRSRVEALFHLVCSLVRGPRS